MSSHRHLLSPIGGAFKLSAELQIDVLGEVLVQLAAVMRTIVSFAPPAGFGEISLMGRSG
jgi:hypothetical protein